MGRRGFTLAATLALTTGCFLPTERSDELRVEIAPFDDLIVGESSQLTGRVIDAAGRIIPNTAVTFEADDPSVAAVGSDGGVTALAVGGTTVTARAVGFTEAASDSRPLVVRDRIAIDSVRPASVRYGETVELFGVGLDPERLLLVSLGGATAPISRYVPDDPTAPNRFGTLTVWAAPPAPMRSLAVVISIDGTRASPETTVVEQRDLYEPNDTVAWDFGSLGGSDSIFNPALAFEPLGRDDTVRTDWYRFGQSQTLDRTLIIRPGSAGPASYAAFVTHALRWQPGGGFRLGSDSWTIGPGFYACDGVPFEPQQRVPDSIVVALRDLPAGAYDVLAIYVREGAYGLAVLPGYHSVLPPDAAEENDYCDVAARLTPDWSVSDLTIDNPFEVDWFRFTMTGSDTLSVVVDAADPNALLDIYLFRADVPSSLSEQDRRLANGPLNELMTLTDAGDYLLAVVDFAGRATTYRLTLSLGPTPEVTGRHRTLPRDVPQPLPRLRVGGGR